MGDELDILLYISSKLDSTTSELSTTTSVMAAELETSQQTISRRLRECEEEGLITRNVTPSGITITLSEKAIAILTKHHVGLTQFFSHKKQSVTGTVQSGLGEGRYYMAIEGYQKQFQHKLGFTPFLGTLNININESDANLLQDVTTKIVIDGFETPERTYGGIDCYSVNIIVNGEKIEGTLIVPHRTAHKKSTIELIAPFSFREKFRLQDGDEVRLQR